MVKEEDIYPIDTVVRLKSTGQFCLIKKQVYVLDGKGFLHYLAIIEGREREDNGLYAIYHQDVELEALPK